MTEENTATWQEQQLYGGSVQCSLPIYFQDLSDLRPVPDFQECWFDSRTNTLLVTEILDPHEPPRDLEWYFRNLVEENDGMTTTQPTDIVEHSLPVSQHQEHRWTGWGHYTASSNNHCLHMGLVRLEAPAMADILISLTTPTNNDDELQQEQRTTLFRRIFDSFAVRDMGLFGVGNNADVTTIEESSLPQ